MYVKINPTSQVPTLLMDGHQFNETIPICLFLEERFPNSKSLLPKDINKKANVLRICEFINSSMHPM
jgi:glutathione S-transferase